MWEKFAILLCDDRIARIMFDTMFTFIYAMKKKKKKTQLWDIKPVSQSCPVYDLIKR